MKNGAFIMPRTDDDFCRIKHWMVSRDKIYKTMFVEVAAGEMRPFIMVDFSLFDKILFKLTFGDGGVMYK